MSASATASALRYCCQPPRIERMLPDDMSPARTRAIMKDAKKWVNGTHLTYYCFREGDACPSAWFGRGADIDEVHTAFAHWHDLGIGIDFVPAAKPADATIRIGFHPKDGSWSYVGRDALEYKDPLERTMNFGWPLDTAYGRDTALHEIGHALGLEHEHQNPHAGIEWDEAAVIAYFKGAPNHWSEATTRTNVLDKIDPAMVKGTTWDRDSVMEYAFDAGLIRSPKALYTSGLQPRGGLSEPDKAWVRQSYPALAGEAPLLEVATSRVVRPEEGETQLFAFVPTVTRRYKIATFGAADTVLVLFQVVAGANVKLAGDDDGGEDRNAMLNLPLVAGTPYRIGVRVLHEANPGETSLMVW